MRCNDLEKIEKALGFKLTELQKKVICAPDEEFFKMKAPEGRLNYTTTAAALRLLFSEGDTVIDLIKYMPGKNNRSEDGVIDGGDHLTDLQKFMIVSSCAGYSGDYSNRLRYSSIFCHTVMKLYNLLWSAGIDVREVTFSWHKKQKCEYSKTFKTDTSSLTELEQTIDRLTEKAEKLSNILSGLNANERQSNQTR